MRAQGVGVEGRALGSLHMAEKVWETSLPFRLRQDEVPAQVRGLGG